ncbi:hypothetical protein D3871_27565 [Noviherbaspirillum saxi]|uniref:ABC transporter domain-containing protein n=2 Tax=Noviherbaspirillum saxi TaxID=2320863 RepID=A0A3A3FN84_9BURK|nr:hypothetical protein D3871_27565 [Noviherbaspirillum saxi]
MPAATNAGLPMKGVVAVLLLGLLLPVVVHDEFILHSLIMVFYFAYLASAWNLMCGYVGQVSFGHSVFSGIGGYVSVLLLTAAGITPWLGMLVGGVLSAVVAVLIGYPTMRLRGPYFALTTIAFAEIIRIWFENTDTIFGIAIKGAEGLSVPLVGTDWTVFQFESKVPYYYIILVMLAIIVGMTAAMERSRLGACLKAIRGDRDAAESLGINPAKYTLMAYALSAFMTALGGSFYAMFIRYINPERNMGVELSIDMALMSIIGGQGTVIGPLVGALFLAPVAELSRTYLGGQLIGLHLVLYGLVLILAVLYLPKGLVHPLMRPWNVCKAGLARTFQLSKPFGGMSTRENLVVGGLVKNNDRRRSEAKADELLDFLGMSALARTDADDLTAFERRKVELGRALSTEPSLLLMDEVVAGATPQEAMIMVGLIKEIRNQGVTVLIIEHVMKVIMGLSDRVIVMHLGELIANGEPSSVVTQPDVLKAYFGGDYVEAGA